MRNKLFFRLKSFFLNSRTKNKQTHNMINLPDGETIESLYQKVIPNQNDPNIVSVPFIVTKDMKIRSAYITWMHTLQQNEGTPTLNVM